MSFFAGLVKFPNTPVEIKVSCTNCGKEQAPIHVGFGEFHIWSRGGQKVQKAFPSLTDTERELLTSGTCASCWDAMFKDADES